MMIELSDVHRRCLIEATIDDLVAYRRGFARHSTGPFFHQRTIQALVGKGLLRAYHPRRGRRGLRISARAE